MTFSAPLKAIALFLLIEAQLPGQISAGSILDVRMLGATGTRISRPGDVVRAVLLSPLTDAGRVLAPAGSEVAGVVTKVEKLGLGLRRNAAQIAYRFDRLQLPDGTTATIDAHIVHADTARESVDEIGQVFGVSPSISVSAPLALYSWRLVMLEPLTGAAVWATKFLLAPSPDPEITFPAGTEFLLRLSSAVFMPETSEPNAIPPPLPEAVHKRAADVLRGFPAFGARKSGQPGDRLNLILAGDAASVERAFYAAGWGGAEDRSPGAIFRTYMAIVQRRAHSTGPMAPLFLDGRRPDAVFQKSLNTFSRRHHVRLWLTGHHVDGQPIWIGSATEDTEIGFSREAKRWVHFIDPHIDNERTKVVADLAYTRCIDGLSLLETPTVDLAGVETDGRVAVARLGECLNPREVPRPGAVVKQGNRVVRALEALSRDAMRSNFITLGLGSLRLTPRAKTFLAGSEPASADRTEWTAQQLEWMLTAEAR